MRRSMLAVVRLAACVLFSHTASAQTGRIEAWGGLTLVAANLDTTITTEYVPSFQSYSPGLPGSTAGQTVQFLSGGTAGVGGGVNLFFSRHAGFQFLIHSDSRNLDGTNGDYRVLLNYITMNPDHPVEFQSSYEGIFTACDACQALGCVLPTTGSFRQTTLGFNLVGRWQAGRRVNTEVSGGLSYARLSGDATSLRYSSFVMGGHHVLSPVEYQLGYSIGPAHGYGFNLGATFDIELGHGVAVTADGRYFGQSDIAAPIVITEVTNQHQIILEQDVATIQQTLHPPDVQISPTRFRVLVGLKIRK